MLFRFLRQYFHDEDFEQKKVELAQTRQVLDLYKEFIQEQLNQNENEKEKVDPEFLGLLWGSIGVALAIAGQAFSAVLEGKETTLLSIDWPYIMIAISAFLFAVLNLSSAIKLTNGYTSSKSDKRYHFFSTTLGIGVSIIIINLVWVIWNVAANTSR